jgi:glycosyltransferase involved in cell wall biosynthesis
MKDFIVKEFEVKPNKIFVVPLGANDEIYKPIKNSVNDKRITNVLFFGLYNPLHGVSYIMNAIKLLKKEKNISFTMIGDGYLKNEIVEFAMVNKLNNVRFIGFMPEKELVSYIQDSDIMRGVFSNIPVFHRAIPNNVFAAIACGKPLISAKLPPMDEYFKHEENIYFCKPEDPKDLALAIKKLSEDPKLHNSLASNGYRLFLKRFIPKQIGKVLVEELKK